MPSATVRCTNSCDELALYRTVQEALANAVRHASPRHIEVQVQARDRGVWLQVDDDGPGFPDAVLRSSGRQSGLAGMRERVTALGGRVTLGRTDEGGARGEVWIPATEGQKR